MMTWAPLLAADITPYLKVIFAIVAITIMAINHLLAGLKKARKPLPPSSSGSAPQGSAPARQELNAEVEEFLRRAAQQRNPQNPARQPTPVSPGAARRNEGHRKQKQKSREPKPAVAMLKPDDSLANRHMTSRLATNTLDERAEQLSSLDKQNEIDAHVQQSLDHQVGQLTSQFAGSGPSASGTAATAGTINLSADSASALAALLRDPQSIRTAIILNEILARPVDRW